MKKAVALLIATTALTATTGVLAWSLVHDGGRDSVDAFANRSEMLPLVFASDDDDRDHRRRPRHEHDDDDDDDDDDDHDTNDDRPRDSRKPAPAAPTGPIAPPQNGLFGNGAPPQVQVN
ncbi:hypothetical protein [uncultured Amaricoccus sp.]|uniref:hypothetical protein n=1 Tax=uncultured Amaricoccus sp. TaxID=339341 RepID=UPI0026132934|nr:hypothetical protein [uncultured Amaricoccus sp.]